MAMRDLGEAEGFVAGAIGVPGQRRFYLQVTADDVGYWLPAEKQQVEALGTQAQTLLEAAGVVPDRETVNLIKTQLVITEPEAEYFRVGGVQVAILEADRIALVVSDPDGDGSIRFTITPEQLQAMAEVALQVVSSGRPICPKCQLPEDPEGHRCPSTNGYHPS